MTTPAERKEGERRFARIEAALADLEFAMSELRNRVRELEKRSAEKVIK